MRRFTEGYRLPLEATASVRGSRNGELVARCVVECGTSSFYTAIRDATDEPVLKMVAAKIAAAPGSTLVATKTVLRRAWELMGMRMHLQMSNDMVAVVAGHSDFRDHMRKLVESKLKPREKLAEDAQKK